MDKLGYKCFEQLGSPRPLIVAKFNFKTRLQSKFLVFLSPFVCVGFQSLLKVLIWSILILFLKNCKKGCKKCRIWCWFRICWKSCKRLLREKLSAKMWQTKGIFDFYYYVQKFWSITSCRWNVLNFFQWVPFYDNHMEFLQKQFCLY
jgi:hypothetical protein